MLRKSETIARRNTAKKQLMEDEDYSKWTDTLKQLEKDAMPDEIQDMYGNGYYLAYSPFLNKLRHIIYEGHPHDIDIAKNEAMLRKGMIPKDDVGNGAIYLKPTTSQQLKSDTPRKYNLLRIYSNRLEPDDISTFKNFLSSGKVISDMSPYQLSSLLDSKPHEIAEYLRDFSELNDDDADAYNDMIGEDEDDSYSDEKARRYYNSMDLPYYYNSTDEQDISNMLSKFGDKVKVLPYNSDPFMLYNDPDIEKYIPMFLPEEPDDTQKSINDTFTDWRF